MEDLRDKKITLMGLGTHGGGLGVAKWLVRHGARLTVTDLRDQHALAKPMAELERVALKEHARQGRKKVHRPRYVLGEHRDEDFTETDMVIRNPAVPRESPYLKKAEAADVPVETEVGLFLKLCPVPVTGITGTKGKSTVTTLLADIAKRHDRRAVVGGNIRISQWDALDRLLKSSEKTRIGSPPPVILELSSWQLEGLERHRLSPHVGVITNIKEDHLNRYGGSMAAYARAKSLIVAYQKEGDIAVLNADDRRIAAVVEGVGPKGATFGGRTFWFSTKVLTTGDGCFVRGGKVVIRDGGKETAVVPVSAIKVPGEHNVANVVAAVAAAHVMGMPKKEIAAGIRAFRGVPGRLEDLGVVRGVRFVNDTTATMPDASVAAMRALAPKKGKRIVLISGGADKDLTFDEWAGEVKKRAKLVVLFDGTATPKMEAALERAGAAASVSGARDMREAVKEAMAHAKKGDIVLLSPGCASFGVFKNEFDRGEKFVKAFKALK